MTDKQFSYILKYLYAELCAVVDNYEFIISNPREDECSRTLAVVVSRDMYERLKYHFSQLTDIDKTRET